MLRDQRRTVEKGHGHERLHMRDLLLSELGDLGEYVPPVEIRGGRLLGSSG